VLPNNSRQLRLVWFINHTEPIFCGYYQNFIGFLYKTVFTELFKPYLLRNLINQTELTKLTEHAPMATLINTFFLSRVENSKISNSAQVEPGNTPRATRVANMHPVLAAQIATLALSPEHFTCAEVTGAVGQAQGTSGSGAVAA
jgi:hypothetical protein